MWEDKNQLSSVALKVDGATTMDSDKTGASLQAKRQGIADLRI